MESAISSFNCELCNKRFSQKSTRNRHVREQHLQPGLYQCKHCGLRFSKKYNLQMHLKNVHTKKLKTNIKQLKCIYCKEIFIKLANLESHIKEQHESVNDKISESSNLYEADVFESDAQAVAELVLKELKQLQKDIQPTGPDKVPELTANKPTTVKYKIIKDNLYPSGHFTQLKVKTINYANGSTYLVCEFCGKEFNKRYNFLRHLRIHTKIRPFICVLCKKLFATTAQLKTHCSIHKLHDKFGLFRKLYKCPQCNEGFTARQQLDKHLSSSISCCKVKFKCPQCLKSYKTLKRLLSHKHSEKDNELDLLKKILPAPLTVADVENDLYECNLCGLQLNGRMLLKQHEKRHANLFKHQCTECSGTYATQAALKIHMKAHLKRTHFKCHYCSKTFKTAQNCRSHMMTHLKLLIKTHAALNDQNDSLVAYPTFIENEANVQIQITDTAIIKTNKKCATPPDQGSKGRNTLKYKCSECNKLFRYNAWLKKHFQYKHTTELTHECNKCLRKFRTKQSLNNHQLVHLTQRVKLTCQVCARQYASSKSLKLHLRIHTQEKPFVCDKCPKLFRTSGHLIQHRKSNHNE
ncbi:zinc finger protein 91-like [Calliphora vicina]|uniref:zinc finger protein 91-like n=1 Tax=Calliphora vicina TaxID=7373 RepID=UPI00325A7DA7